MSTPDRPRAILFDMDGVLVDSVDSWLAVVNHVRVDLGFDPISQAHLMTIFGQGVEDDAKNLYPGHEPAAIRRAYDEAMPRFVDRVKSGPDTRSVLRDLERGGIARAVVTNTQHSLANDMLRAAGLDGAFDVVAAAGLAAREKPHPDMLHLVLETLDVPPAAALMLGDTHYDEEAAAAAGVRYLHFDLRRGGRLREALRAYLD